MRQLAKRLRQLVSGDAGHRRNLADIGTLLGGDFFGAVLALAAFALTARALGPADYGVLVLAQAYSRGVARLLSSRSWQAIIRYGALAHAERRADELGMLLKFGLILDLGVAVLAWAVAVAGVLVANAWTGWIGDRAGFVIAYCTVLLVNASGTPTAVLRLSGRFRLVAVGNAVNSLTGLVLSAIGVAMGFGLVWFGVVWAGLQVLAAVTTWVLALIDLRALGVRGLWSAPVRGLRQRFPDLWSYAGTTNLTATLRNTMVEFDTLLVAALTDAGAAGLYQIARRMARFVHMAGANAQTVIYPDIARARARGDRALILSRVQTSETLLAGFGIAAFLAFLPLAEPLLRWSAGPAFVSAAPLLQVQMAAVAAALTGIALRSALNAMGYQRQVLRITVVATTLFFVLVLILVPRIGPMGANIAHLVSALVTTAALLLAFRKARRDPAAVPGAPAAAAQDPD